MENSNSKILTLSYAIAGALVGLGLSLLIKAFAGAFGIVARMADSDLIRHGLPVAVGLGLFAFLQFNPKTHVWGNDVIAELKKVVFPTRKDTTAMTIVVIIMVAISAVIISTFDLVAGYLINVAMR